MTCSHLEARRYVLKSELEARALEVDGQKHTGERTGKWRASRELLLTSLLGSHFLNYLEPIFYLLLFSNSPSKRKEVHPRMQREFLAL